jgi:hypothetical protein
MDFATHAASVNSRFTLFATAAAFPFKRPLSFIPLRSLDRLHDRFSTLMRQRVALRTSALPSPNDD